MSFTCEEGFSLLLLETCVNLIRNHDVTFRLELALLIESFQVVEILKLYAMNEIK